MSHAVRAAQGCSAACPDSCPACERRLFERRGGDDGSRSNEHGGGDTQPPPTVTGPSRQARLRVVSGPAGVVAFVKVYVKGKGPFAFSVDTGASHSVIDFEVVRKLGLKTIGDPVTITGIACSGTAGWLRMAKWRAGGIRLPATKIQTIDMPSPEIDGLLGSDVLSTFGTITIDYEGERLLIAEAA